MKTKIIFSLSIALACNISVAQDKWDTDGNIGIGSGAKLGPKFLK